MALTTESSPEELQAKIKQLGFDSVDEYQAFHGLQPDGQLNSATIRTLIDPWRFCGVPDNIQPLGEGISSWGKKVISFGFTGLIPGLDLKMMREVFQRSFDRWASVADVGAHYIKKAGDIADMLVEIGRIDGKGSTLAWSFMPGNKTTNSLKQRYEAEENWVVSDRAPGSMIDLGRVTLHEIGHFWGLPHLRSNNVMQSSYHPDIYLPQNEDIYEMQKRYGPPKPATTPTSPTAPGFKDFVTIPSFTIPKEWIKS